MFEQSVFVQRSWLIVESADICLCFSFNYCNVYAVISNRFWFVWLFVSCYSLTYVLSMHKRSINMVLLLLKVYINCFTYDFFFISSDPIVSFKSDIPVPHSYIVAHLWSPLKYCGFTKVIVSGLELQPKLLKWVFQKYTLKSSVVGHPDSVKRSLKKCSFISKPNFALHSLRWWLH